ncbi:hypothetical protein KBI52_18125 [Microvirga sp. HBU67558]|uniref:Rap1a/Tai family immunity protein n=1 Tax=Microvirga TaxID=186650 RepID=UPI001B3816FB|nr:MULTISPECIES: Rap1a/Tai family immunity protein [unclassified Microvirga]MBQ0822111.1 hypothetical protein [Microvirga sp. HBU67558]
MKKFIVGSIILLASISTSFADEYFVTGQQFVNDHCDKNQVAANRYVVGIHDGFLAANSDNPKKQICSPNNVTAGQLTAVACKYVREDPKSWNNPASYLIIYSLILAWPCP